MTPLRALAFVLAWITASVVVVTGIVHLARWVVGGET